MIIIYRYNNTVAVSINNQPTQYISVEDAEALVNTLKILTKDIKEVTYSKSYSNTYLIGE